MSTGRTIAVCLFVLAAAYLGPIKGHYAEATFDLVLAVLIVLNAMQQRKSDA